MARLRRLLQSHPFDRRAWNPVVTDDLHVRIGNAAPVIGRDAALAELGAFVSRTESIGAGFFETCRRAQTVFAEVEVDFKDAAGGVRGIPCVMVMRWVGESLIDLRIHLDTSTIPMDRKP
jgi:hypothetical protein